MSSKAIIFDMDGLLVDSEPLWRAVEVRVFGEVGIEMTEADAAQTIGVRVDEVVKLRYSQKPWSGRSLADVERAIVDGVVDRVRQGISIKPGVRELLTLAKAKSFATAIASSSPLRMIEAVVQTLSLGGSFDVLQSGEHEKFGKPDPAVFLKAAAGLGVEPKDCLVLEDSLAGLRGAKRAGMLCVCVPDPSLERRVVSAEADLVLDSLEQLTEDLLAELGFISGLASAV